VVEALVRAGVPPELARREVEQTAASAALGEARRLQRRVEALEQMIRLRAEHRATQDRSIARRTMPTVEEFLASYWIPGVPVIIEDLVRRWPAFMSWSPAYFAEHYGDVVVQACIGRSKILDPDPEWSQVCRELPMKELVGRIETAGTSNDVYVIAKNAAFRRPGLSGLAHDLVLPPEYFGPVADLERMGFWFGPAGTHTPLHHDGDNVMFCQVFGRKRVRLAAPDSVALLDRSRGVYSSWDPVDLTPDDPERLFELVLLPGDALFIPAGWWHQVDALDASASVSILQFAWPNDFSWYRPGSLLRGSAR
jgi:hypothetical protein